MTPNILEKNCTETGLHAFMTEASTSGFSVGQWPDQVPTDMGNKLPFLRGKPFYHQDEEGDRELLYMDYVQSNGCVTVRVFND